MEREKRALELSEADNSATSNKLRRVEQGAPGTTIDARKWTVDRSGGFTSLPIEITISILEKYLNRSAGDANFGMPEGIAVQMQRLKKLKLLNRSHYMLIMNSPAIASFLVDKLAYDFFCPEEHLADRLQMPSIQTKKFQKWLDRRNKRNRFTHLVKLGDFKEAQIVLNEIGINCIDKEGNTPLLTLCNGDICTASEFSQYSNLENFDSALLEFLKTMLAQKDKNGIPADLNLPNKRGFTPLIAAVRNDTSLACEILCALLRTKVDLNHSDKDGNTALYYAAYEGIEKLKVLLDAHATIEHTNHNGETALHNAAEDFIHERGERIRELIKRGARKDAKNRVGYTPLHFACYNFMDYPVVDPEDLLILKLLIDSDTINSQTIYGQTPLMLVAQHYNTLSGGLVIEGARELAQFLVENGAKLDLKDDKGRTALDIAIECNNRPVVEYLRILYAQANH